MGITTGISWTHHTFNPWRGCTKVAPECHSCYADQLAKRNPGTLGVWGPNGTRVMGAPAYWKEPIKWNREAEKAGERRRVFCASLADVFEDWPGEIKTHDADIAHACQECDYVGLWPLIRRQLAGGFVCPGCEAVNSGRHATMDDLRRKMFSLIDATPHLDWLLLTKRPENVQRMWCSHVNTDGKPPSMLRRDNVWLGTSAGTQATANKAIPHLLACRELAPVLFVSDEPMLDAVDYANVSGRIDAAEQWGRPVFDGIDWLIIGVESNGQRVGRLGDFANESAWLAHARKLVDQCRRAGVTPFVKQIPLNGKLSHDIAEWPSALAVQEFPTPTTEGE